MAERNVGEKEGRGLRFYPDYFVEVLVVAVAAVELILVLALLFPAILGRRIDLVGQFSPRPEWYFLWLYELVKYFPGQSAVIGTVAIPLGILTTLVLVPWMDPEGRRSWLARTLWLGTLALAGVLTAVSLGGDSW